MKEEIKISKATQYWLAGALGNMACLALPSGHVQGDPSGTCRWTSCPVITCVISFGGKFWFLPSVSERGLSESLASASGESTCI